MNHRAAVCALLLLCLAATPALAQEPESWHGIVDLSAAGAGELEFFVTFLVDGDEPSATISIPAQAARDLPLANVVYTDARIEFTLAAAVAAVFTADRDGASATGALNQGAEYPLTMERTAEGEAPAAPNRPQTPQAPFPYESRDVSYTNPIEGNTIAGTLSVPAGIGPHAAALLITGSGSQDRDETIFEHKPFWVIADYLSRRGIAVLRLDDRGVGGSDGRRRCGRRRGFPALSE